MLTTLRGGVNNNRLAVHQMTLALSGATNIVSQKANGVFSERALPSAPAGRSRTERAITASPSPVAMRQSSLTLLS